MRHVPSLRLWFGVPAVLVGVLIGVLTNIVTATPSLAGVAGLVAAVAMLVGLTVWQAGRDQQGRMAALRAERAPVLTSLRPEPPGKHTISTLLAAGHALVPFRARRTETQEVLDWCLDAAAPTVRVLAGQAGWARAGLRWRSPGSSRTAG